MSARPPTVPEVVCLTATDAGRAIAARLPYPHVHGDVAAALRARWHDVDGFVVVLAAGASVRLVAPLLEGKDRDPAVVCVDDAGRFALALLGGHGAGANALAADVAALLGAEPVVTTASERVGVVALDQLPGLRAEGDLSRLGAALVSGGTLALRNELGWPVPEALLARSVPEAAEAAEAAGAAGPHRPGTPHRGRAPRQAGSGGLVVLTDRVAGGDPSPVVYLRPESLVAGAGTSTCATPADVLEAISDALRAAGLARGALGALATLDRRAEHPALLGAAAELGVPLVAFPAATLDTVEVPTPSPVVRDAVGTGSVAEAAALLASGPGGRLAAGKRRSARVTVALARRARPSGGVQVVGLGPGGAAHRTPAAARAVRHAQVVVGLSAYVDQCADLVSPSQRVLRFALGEERERARAALDEARQGRRVALVCSGDAGVYAMASPLLELAEAAGVDVEVVPGVTAAVAAGALLGAPLGHDHAVVSLSDLLTPWSRIAARLEAAAAADFVVVLYNPRSSRRTWQLGAAREILLAHRPPTTPVGVVTDAGRPGERVRHSTLGDLDPEEVSMASCVIVGSTRTRRVAGRMVTPRGYPE